MTREIWRPNRRRGVQNGPPAVVALMLMAVIGCDSSVARVDSPARRDSVATISMTPQTLRFSLADTQTVIATPLASDGSSIVTSINWIVGDSAVAAVSESGLVKGVGLGSTFVRAFAGGKYGQIDVSVVIIEQTRLLVYPGNVHITAGDTVRLNVVGHVQDFPVAWRFSNEGVASLNATYLLTALKPASTDLYVYSAADPTRWARVDITVH